MKKTTETAPNLHTNTEPDTYAYTPSQAQIDALARRLLPEIKKFFADGQVQKEFAEWQATQNTINPDK